MSGTPREPILQAIKARLEGITSAGGFNNTVKTVQIGFVLPTALHRSDTPHIQIGPQEDRDDGESLGAQTNDRYRRAWEIEIRGMMWPDSDVRAKGELLIDDIVKRLTTSKTFGLSPTYKLGFTLDRIIEPDHFEADESGMAYVGVDITVSYDFTPANL